MSTNTGFLHADYPGRAAAEEHWRLVRAKLKPANTREKPWSLRQAAERQIAILERDLAEWRVIVERERRSEGD